MLHGTGNIDLRTFTISSSHSCSYNPRSLTLRPVETYVKLVSDFLRLPFGVFRSMAYFQGLLLKKTSRYLQIFQSSHSSFLPRMSSVCHRSPTSGRDFRLGFPTQFGREGGLARRRGSSNANHLRHTVRHMEGIYPFRFCEFSWLIR